MFTSHSPIMASLQLLLRGPLLFTGDLCFPISCMGRGSVMGGGLKSTLLVPSPVSATLSTLLLAEGSRTSDSLDTGKAPSNTTVNFEASAVMPSPSLSFLIWRVRILIPTLHSGTGANKKRRAK